MIRRILFIAAILYVAYLTAVTAVAGKPMNFLGPFAAIGLLVLLSRRPEWGFTFGLLLIVRFFGLFYVHVPGLFKVFDLGLVLCMASGWILWKTRLSLQSDIYTGSFRSVIILFTAYIAFQILQTVVGEGQSLIMTVQIARFYIFYLVFFAAVPVFVQYPEWYKQLKWLLILGILGAALYVLQSIFSFGFLNFLFSTGSNTLAGGNRVNRLFGGISTPDRLIAGTLLGYLVYGRAGKYRLFFTISLGIICLKPLLSFGRGYIAAFFSSLFIVVIFANVRSILKVRLVGYSTFIILLFLGLASVLSNKNMAKYSELVYLRMQQGMENYMEKTGTYELRYQLRQKKLEIILENPIVGVGFIHPASGLLPQINSLLRSGHDGYGTLWGELGFLGFGVFVFFTLVIFINAFKVSRMDVPVFYRAFSLSVMGLMVSGYVNMLSTSSFILEASFTYMGLSMAALQVITLKYRQDRNSFAAEETAVIV